MAKDFVEKKALIVSKLRELRSQNRSIEEIYKYTNDIILEEEDEDEEESEDEKVSRKISKKAPKTQTPYLNNRTLDETKSTIERRGSFISAMGSIHDEESG